MDIIATYRVALCGLLVCALFGGNSAATRADEPKRAADTLSAQIDQLIAARWQTAHVQPSERSSDAEFIRRIYLDVTGSIPQVAEVRAFLKDESPNKRRQPLIERLLAGPGYVSYSASNWRRLIAPDAENDPNRQAAALALEKWLQRQFAENVGFDKTVRALLTWPVNGTLGEDSDPAALRRASFISNAPTSPTSWLLQPPGSSSACGSSALSATTTPSPAGAANNSGARPHSSRA